MTRRSSFVVLTLGAVCLWVSGAKGAEDIKTPNVAGQFYSADPTELSSQIDTFLNAALVRPSDRKIDILISPHAGYVFSGSVAAYGYKAISQTHYATVIIIAPSHHVDFEGFALWPKGSFLTPLGTVNVDEEFSLRLASLNSRIKVIPQAFQKEHALEVQLPFLQKTLKDFKIVPLLSGRPSLEDCKKMAAALNETITGRDDVLIVISTDMSHYYDDATARRMDYNALSAIKDLNVDTFWTQCLLRKDMELCGFPGVTTALLYAKASGIDGIDILKYANSGDAFGDRTRVVGYGAITFYKKETDAMKKEQQENPSLTLPQKKRLLEIAQKTVEAYIGKGEVLEFSESDPRLLSKEGAFVTLHKFGQLRGCIGNIIGEKPLYITVRDMTIASATKDPRFPPVTKNELGDIDIEISVLSVPRRITNMGEIILGTHGVIVSRDVFHRGVFLPQVATEQNWSKEEFLSNLCAHKAGLAPDAWKDPRTTIEIFSAQVFSKKDIGE